MRKEVQCSNNKRLINWRFNSMLLLKIQLTLFICLGLHMPVLGQEAQILITNPAGVNVCDASQQVDIQILNIHTETLVNNSITIVLPTGIEYVSSSLSEQSSFNISEQNITNLSSIVLAADDLPVSQTMQFSINITANMDAIAFQDAGNVFRNDVTLSYDGGSTNSLSNAYNLYYPVLSIISISPTSKNLNSGDSFTRDITIVNAGNGRVSAFKINDVHASGIAVTSVNIGSLDGAGAIITLSGADFTGVGNNDNYFDTNESITITQSISGSGCDNATVTSTITNLWECSGNQIVSSNSYGHVSLSLKTPNIGVATTSELSSCFGDSEGSSHSITLTNNGQGKADDVQLDVYKSLGSGYQQNIFSRIDESNITYQINGGSSVAITPTTTYVTDTSGDYSCLGSSPIGRVILDLPDLDPGDQILISFQTFHCNINICNGDYVKGWKYDLTYNDVCNNSNYSKSGTGQNENETNMSIFTETPTDINDGETKEFSFTVSSFSNDLPEDTGAQYKVVFDLPAGLAYSNLEFYHNVLWTASSINYDTGANQVTAYYDLPVPSDFNITKAAFNLDITGDCNMSGAATGPVNIVMNINYITSSNCSFEVPFICNATETVDLHCNTGVGCEGMSFESFSFKRTSFGLPDNDQNGLPDSSGSIDLSAVKENRVMLGDSIQGVFQGTIYTSPTNTDWAFSYASQNIEKGTYLTPIGASIVVYDASTSSNITCAVLPITSVASGDDKTFTYDISPSALASSCASFSGFIYESGDTVTLYTNYEVTTNLEGGVEQLKSTNEFYTSNIVNPGTNDKYQCGYYNDNFTLIGYNFLNSSRNYFSVTSCSKTVNQYFYLSIGDCCSNYNGGNLFPSEYRNWAHIKSATVEIPDNYDMSNVVLKIWRTKKTNSSASETVTDISPSQIVGNLYTFDLEQHYAAYGGTINLSDDGFKGKLSMDLTPNCDVPINAYENLTWKFNFSKGDFLGGGESGLLEATNPDRLKFNPPSLALSSDNPILLGLTETVSWDFKVNTNSSNINADNAWIHIKNPTGATQIIQVIDDDTGQEIPLTGDIYKLGQLTGSSVKDLTIIAKYTDCIPDYITVYSGYECTSYPENFSDFTCGFSTYGLFVEPEPTGMQVTLEGINVGDICGSTVEIEIDVSSVKKGSLKNISISIDPVGDSMTFEASSGQIQYPLSSSYLAVSDPTVDGSNNYVYTIADIESTISTNGLPGVLDLSNNHFKLKFNMDIDSSFEPGDHALVSISSESMCGEVNPTINLAFDPSIGFKIDSSAGLTSDTTDSWAASWGDYNNDGYDDLFVTTYDETEPNILYENNGDKTFTKVTTGDIVNDVAKSLGATWGDYNNDGHLDLFVANNGGVRNFLYKNNGDGTFTKITSGDIVEYGVYCHSAAWADYDNDGYLDLFVTEYFSTNTNHLFHNNGDGTFTRIEDSPVVTD
ncbi:MAG: VCBS repeat-containing protein, partial [Flavobacteriaceae bacterium]|nr:VCBS repeat-containing protein [Flavobacteriaceae bacterium]